MIVVQILYMTIRMVFLGFQMGGNPSSEAQRVASSGSAILILLFVAVVLVGLLGGRRPARKAQGSHLLNGVLDGMLLTLFRIVWSAIGGGFSVWALVVAAVIVGLAALGGWVGGRAAEAKAYA
jgi:hypothetical protein